MSSSLHSTIARLQRERAPRTTWQIKVGTLCNLRCSYCYEWNRLADARRLTLDQWRVVLEAVRDHHARRMSDAGPKATTTLAWHGGEPTLLPVAYVERVLDLQREILGNAGRRGIPVIRNAVQTNLTRTGPTLDRMASAGFLISASVDFAPQVRVDRQGRDIDSRVRANMQRMIASGAVCGAAVVLGRHNAGRLEEIHDVLLDMGAAWLNVFPMFRPPREAPGGDLLLPAREVVDALERLFVHWVDRGARLQVNPLQRALRMASAPQRPAGRSRFPRDEHLRLIVHPDGTVARSAGADGSAAALGNLFTQSIGDIMRGVAWRASEQRRNTLAWRHCGRCRYRHACDGRPVFEAVDRLAPGACPIESELVRRIERFLRRAGIGEVVEAAW